MDAEHKRLRIGFAVKEKLDTGLANMCIDMCVDTCIDMPASVPLGKVDSEYYAKYVAQAYLWLCSLQLQSRRNDPGDFFEQPIV